MIARAKLRLELPAGHGHFATTSMDKLTELPIPQIPGAVVKVSESAILVGEALVRAEDPEAPVKTFHYA